MLSTLGILGLLGCIFDSLKNKNKNKKSNNFSDAYFITIQSEVSYSFGEILDLEVISNENGITKLYGFFEDQTQFHSLLIKLRDLNLKIISINIEEK